MREKQGEDLEKEDRYLQATHPIRVLLGRGGTEAVTPSSVLQRDSGDDAVCGTYISLPDRVVCLFTIRILQS